MRNNFYLEGFEAYEKGLKLSDNPYKLNSLPAFQWQQGWADAFEHYRSKGE